MNSVFSHLRLTTLALATAGALLAACASTPPADARLTQLQTAMDSYRNSSGLAAGAPLAVRQADDAIARATSLQGDKGYEAALYDATQKIAIVKAQAERLNAEADIDRLNAERAQIQLDARTMEAARAQRQAMAAQAAADAANARYAALLVQMSEYQGRQTERGLVLTLGDVLFATGRAELRPGAELRLARLVEFLRQAPARAIAIEGHTDNVGKAAYNLKLSEARAFTVRDYLVAQGVEAGRITAVGQGKEYPVADNHTAAGRQANRRVELIIANEVTLAH